MTRAIVFLVTLMVLLPADGSSQDIPSPGDRIRITHVDGTIFTGTLAGASDEVIQLSADSSRVGGRTTFPRSQITTLERQEGTSDRRNLVGIVGLVAGGAIAWATLDDANNTKDDLLRVFLGMAVGGVGGALIGSAIRTENWVIVPWIEVAPSGQSASASGGSSQDILSPGDRIRITEVDGTILTGTLAAVSDEVIQLSVDSSRVVDRTTLPRSRIATLERHEGTSDWRNLGAVVGLLAGAAIAVATLEDHDEIRGRSCGLTGVCAVVALADVGGRVINNTMQDALRVSLGILVGAVAGALVGSTIHTENWVIVPSIEVAPSGQSTSASGFSFGLRVARVGRPW